MIIDIQNLSKNYQSGDEQLHILSNLSMQVKEGEVVGILGRSGSGKSTLLSIIGGLEAFSEGQVQVAGQQLKSMNDQEKTAFRANNVSYVFQQYHLVPHLTAYENVCLPLWMRQKTKGEKVSDQHVNGILQELGLSERKTHKPSQMSGGENQRVTIARALAAQPKILLADEPSASLDTETGQKVMDLFFGAVRQHKMTTLLVTHDEAIAKRCDRILRLVAGKLTGKLT